MVAKDRTHLALVVARPGGAVQMLVAPKALARTAVGRMVVIRYAGPASRLPVALTVSPVGASVTRPCAASSCASLSAVAVIEAGGSLARRDADGDSAAHALVHESRRRRSAIV